MHDVALGCAVLGCGGGGDVLLGELRAQQQLLAGKAIRVASVDQWRSGALGDGVVVMCAFFGAPSVMTELLGSGRELRAAVDAVAQGRRVVALCSAEMGGTNGIEPALLAAQLGVPVLDADAMGRAFPKLSHALPLVGDAPQSRLAPSAMADFRGRVLRFDDVRSVAELERRARDAVGELGGAAAIALPPLALDAPLVVGSLRRAHRIGGAIREARQRRRRGAASPVDALLDAVRATGGRGRRLFCGNICDVQRGAALDFVRGSITLRGVGTGDADDEGVLFRVDFQNENIVARRAGVVVATAPDLIVVVERDTARPVFVDELAYGQRVVVCALSCDAQYRTNAAAAAAVAPKSFGFDDILEPVLL